jgi:hypothetical protein
MIRGRWAPHCCMLAAMAFSSYSRADVWGIDPVLGVLGDYSTDPNLVHQRDTGITSAALQVAAPTVYDDDSFKFSMLPSFRVGDSRGFAAVTSDYAHLNLEGDYVSDLYALKANAGIARDSSLAFDYLSTGDVGVRRDAASAELNWDQHLTELVEFDIDGSSQRVNFGKGPTVATLTGTVPTLTDYNYNSIAPSLSWNSSELSKLSLTGAVARSDSLGARDVLLGLPSSTQSRSASLQLGYQVQLSQQWTANASGGYSRAINQSDFFVLRQVPPPPNTLSTTITLEPFPVRIPSAQNGSVYGVDLSHKDSRLVVDALATRQLTPTGFAFLTSQDTYELKTNYTVSERWSFGADGRYVRYQNPELINSTVAQINVLNVINVRYFGLKANWNWTEHSTVILSAARVVQGVDLSRFNVASNEVTLTFSHRFNHIDFM